MRHFWLLLLLASSASAQESPAGMARIAGVDAASGIRFALLSVEGKSLGPAQPATPPRLTAQCTKDAGGKLRFELLADEGAAAPLLFVAPWKPARDSPLPPRVDAVTVTMEYLGYVKESPVKRQWERVSGLSDQLRYSPPGLSSKNLEDISRPLQYLRSLPKLRLSIPGRPVLEFETSAWQAVVKQEPLCAASGW